jgi:glutamate dehydrogenase/leucine dehydrogenase
MNKQTDREILWKEWKDKRTGVRGFVSVFGSGRTHASGGGIRVSPSITPNIVKQIAQIMRSKFFLSGPGVIQTGEPIDGAGIGICARPDQVTPELLIRFLKENEFIRHGIGAAASTGIATNGVCEQLGLVHLQEPIARALNHTKTSLRAAQRSLTLVKEHIPHPISLRHNSPANLATGFTAADIVNNFFLKLKGKRIGLIGFGAAGGSFAHRAMTFGANIVFVANSEGALQIDNSVREIPSLLLKIRKGSAPVPRLHLTDVGQPRDLSTVIRTVTFDSLLMAPTEGVIGQPIIDAIPKNIPIISIANMPWADNILEEAQKKFKIISPNMINLGNAVLHSLACLGCRSKSTQDLLNRTTACANTIIRLEMSNPNNQQTTVWHTVIPKFL